VFVARDLTLDRDVVIKVLSAEAMSVVSADRLRREIQLIAKLEITDAASKAKTVPPR
jgi:hypothetical protein